MRYRYILYIIALLPVFIFRDFTPTNELKYISIVEEALRNNTWFTFYNHGEAYADKPPLYFWLMMIPRLITGGYHMWIMALFSLLPAVGVMMVMDKWCREQEIKNNPILSNILLGTTVMFLGGALVLRMDMLMTFFIVMSLYTFFRMYSGTDKPRDKWLLPAYIFLGTFTKGPMGFLIPMLSIVAFLLIRGKIKTVWQYLGWRQWAVLAGLCAVWFTMVYVEGGVEYLNNILFKQTVGRGIDSFHHKEHLFFYFPRMLYTFAPWSLLFLVTIFTGVRKHLLVTDAEKFFYTIVWVNILMLSLVSSKLDIYMLPIYPFVAYLGSAMLSRTSGNILTKICIAIPAIVLALCYPASFIIKKYIPYEYDSLLMFRTGLVVLSLGSLAALYALKINKSGRAVSSIGIGMLAMLFFAAFDVPQFNPYIGYKARAEAAQEDAWNEGAVSYAFYKYPTAANMDVFLGQPLQQLSEITQLDSLETNPDKTLVFVRAREVRREEELRTWVDLHRKSGETEDFSWFILGGTDEEHREAFEAEEP